MLLYQSLMKSITKRFRRNRGKYGDFSSPDFVQSVCPEDSIRSISFMLTTEHSFIYYGFIHDQN
jgi:hypothetical protein